MSEYKRNPRGARRARKSLSRKALVVLSLMMVLAVAAVGGTVAWLTATTTAVTNTFTVGDINITLTETTSNYKMVPGNTIAKDPKVTVLKDSEACWLFVKVEKSTNLDNFITYSMADGWTQLTDAEGNNVDGVFYREVAASTANQEFSVLAGNTVTVNNTVTKSMMDALKAENAVQPTLTFTAYAVQKDNITTVAAAWAEASK